LETESLGLSPPDDAIGLVGAENKGQVRKLVVSELEHWEKGILNEATNTIFRAP
jgi:hypothetical protein